MEIFRNLPDETPASELRSRDFIIAPTLKFKHSSSPAATDETDSSPKTDPVENLVSSSAIKISQREPLMSMNVLTKGPILVGEWFIVRIDLENGETDDDARHVEIMASLEESGDPIIADTTRITFDTELKDEIEDVEDHTSSATTTPSIEDKVGPESSAQTQQQQQQVPPIVKKIGVVQKGKRKKIYSVFLRIHPVSFL